MSGATSCRHFFFTFHAIQRRSWNLFPVPLVIRVLVRTYQVQRIISRTNEAGVYTKLRVCWLVRGRLGRSSSNACLIGVGCWRDRLLECSGEDRWTLFVRRTRNPGRQILSCLAFSVQCGLCLCCFAVCCFSPFFYVMFFFPSCCVGCCVGPQQQVLVCAYLVPWYVIASCTIRTAVLFGVNIDYLLGLCFWFAPSLTSNMVRIGHPPGGTIFCPRYV